MVVDEFFPLGGGVGEKQLHAGVFGDGDCLADGRGEFIGEFELFQQRVEKVREFVDEAKNGYYENVDKEWFVAVMNSANALNKYLISM